MNERIRIRFTRNGASLPVSHLDIVQGLVFACETSAQPLGFGIGLAAGDPVTKQRLAGVRQIEGWHSDEFHLAVTRDEDTLVVSGGGKSNRAASLPPGRYTLRFAVSETRYRVPAPFIEIPENGEAPVQLDEVAPTLRLSVVDPSRWDEESRAVCCHADSRIDGMDAADWLTQSLPRMARKACLLNLLAKARALPLARRGESFCSAIVCIRWADVDRIDVRATPELVARLRASAGWKDSAPIHPSHAQNMARIFGGQPSDYSIESFREPVPQRSMQIVAATHVASGAVCAEFDIDLGNPLQDLVGLSIHIGELLDPGRTNHLDLYPHLLGGSTSDFLYYRLEEASGQTVGDQ